MLKPSGNGFKMLKLFSSKKRSVRLFKRQVTLLVIIEHLGFLNPNGPSFFQTLKSFYRMFRHRTKGLCYVCITRNRRSGFL